MEYTYNSAFKRNEIPICVTMWINLGNMVGEINQI